MNNPFFRNTGPYEINELLKLIDLKSKDFTEKKVLDIKDLSSAQNKDITFFHSKKYSELAKKTKASYCITTEKFKSILGDKLFLNFQVDNKIIGGLIVKIGSKMVDSSIASKINKLKLSLKEA